MSEIVAWRICGQHRVPTAFTGDGSTRRAGRWNPKGTRIVYCAESRALAALEVLVNVQDAESLADQTWVMIPAVVPLELIERPARVPENWQANPPPRETQEYGARWVVTARAAVLRVPSVVVHGEFNYLLNPAHPDFARIRILAPEPFRFDPRLT